MKKEIEIEIDILTNSIRNVVSEDVFDTEVFRLSKLDHKYLRGGWNFNWVKESNENTVYKLVIKSNPEIIQGLISISDNNDNIFINLIENASFNIGKSKLYEGVAGNLFAFACKYSLDSGYLGNVSFVVKSNLFSHYEEIINAKRVGNSQIMLIDHYAAKLLIEKYYKE